MQVPANWLYTPGIPLIFSRSEGKVFSGEQVSFFRIRKNALDRDFTQPVLSHSSMAGSYQLLILKKKMILPSELQTDKSQEVIKGLQTDREFEENES
jgi:hypothetical protein